MSRREIERIRAADIALGEIRQTETAVYAGEGADAVSIGGDK